MKSKTGGTHVSLKASICDGDGICYASRVEILIELIALLNELKIAITLASYL